MNKLFHKFRGLCSSFDCHFYHLFTYYILSYL
nr:MAG TPA: hypothetical protein [Caudoviricetes sp.]